MTSHTEVVFGNVLLFALVFGLSATVELDNLLKQICNKNAIITGVLLQFLLLPLLGFLSVKIFRLDHTIGIPLLVVTSSPGGSYSNWYTSIFNGDLALSVVMTTVSTILSIVMLPLNLLLYTRLSYDDDILSNIDWTGLFGSISVVVVAIFSGLFASCKLRCNSFRKGANMLGNIAGIGLMVFSATVTNTGEDADSKIWSRDWNFYIGVSLPCLFGLLLAHATASVRELSPPERMTVSIECSYQNVGIASSLALTMFDGADLNSAMGVPFFYAVSEIVCITTYCLVAWKSNWTKAPSSANLCRVLCTSYEVEESACKRQESNDGQSSLSDDTSRTVITDTSTPAELSNNGNVEAQLASV